MTISNHAEATVNALGLRYRDSIFPTRWSVLDHLFCVIGNGFEWKDGLLIERGESEIRLEAYDRGERITFHAKPPKITNGFVDDDRCYPMCEYSALCCIPDNVDASWLALAHEAVEHILKITSDEKTKPSIYIARKVKSQLGSRFDKTLVNRITPS